MAYFVSFSHHRHGYFVLFPDLFPLGSDAVLEVEDSDAPLCYPVPITIGLRNRTMSISIEETNHPAQVAHQIRSALVSITVTSQLFDKNRGHRVLKGVFFVKALPFILVGVWKTHIELLVVEQSFKVKLVENL